MQKAVLLLLTAAVWPNSDSIPHLRIAGSALSCCHPESDAEQDRRHRCGMQGGGGGAGSKRREEERACVCVTRGGEREREEGEDVLRRLRTDSRGLLLRSVVWWQQASGKGMTHDEHPAKQGYTQYGNSRVPTSHLQELQLWKL